MFFQLIALELRSEPEALHYCRRSNDFFQFRVFHFAANPEACERRLIKNNLGTAVPTMFIKNGQKKSFFDRRPSYQSRNLRLHARSSTAEATSFVSFLAQVHTQGI